MNAETALRNRPSSPDLKVPAEFLQCRSQGLRQAKASTYAVTFSFHTHRHIQMLFTPIHGLLSCRKPDIDMGALNCSATIYYSAPPVSWHIHLNFTQRIVWRRSNATGSSNRPVLRNAISRISGILACAVDVPSAQSALTCKTMQTTAS